MVSCICATIFFLLSFESSSLLDDPHEVLANATKKKQACERQQPKKSQPRAQKTTEGVGNHNEENLCVSIYNKMKTMGMYRIAV